jgi:D-alanyl-D-alanine carboxypeptidase/D-alanyl-D-alanine-endopeptidase (penicillin-binding protein 4)
VTRRATVTLALAALVTVGGLANASLGLRRFQSAAPGPVAAPGPAAAPASPAAPAVLNARRVAPLVSSLVGRARLRGTISSAISPAVIGNASRTTCARVDEAGIPIASVNAAEPLLAASTQKLLTAETVLATIDPSWRPRTEVRAARPVVDGVVDGDLWVVGGGDPLLSTAQHVAAMRRPQPVTSAEELADRIAAAGVRRVAGRLVVDDRRYDDVRLVPSWKSSYVSRRDVGPIGALVIDDGFAAPPGGTAPRDAPDLGAGAVLAALLEARGVTIDGAVARPAADDEATRSAPVAITSIDGAGRDELVAEMLAESDNVTAEMLLKEVAFQVTGGPGATAAGATAALGALERLGVPTAGANIVDGSGLDRGNRLTCDLLVAVLAAAAEAAGATIGDAAGSSAAGSAGPLLGGLPVAGQSGTMSRRLTGPATVGRVHAKTGTLNGVSSLAGFVDTLSGRRLLFAVIVNGLGGEDTSPAAVADRVVEAVAGYPSVTETGWELRP